MTSTSDSSPLLEVRGVSKRFGAVVALDDVSLQIRRAERLAVMGENGAGKSTLMKLLAGVYTPDEGSMTLNGEPYAPADPHAALALGVSTVYQEPAFFAHLSVLENLFMGQLPRTRLGSVDTRTMRTEALALLRRLNLPEKLLDRKMGELSLGEQQQVLIARAVRVDARILILDEPTSILTRAESDRLFDIVDTLIESGTSVVSITHRFDELDRLGDRFIVLRDGKYVGETDDPAQEPLLRMMGGRSGAALAPLAAEDRPPLPEGTEPTLHVDRLTVDGQFSDISLDVFPGRITGLYGLVGAGRSEVALTIFGATKLTSGSMTLTGRPYLPRSTHDALRHGVAYVPEDRKTQGVFPFMNVTENLTASTHEKIATTGLIRVAKEQGFVATWISRFSIKTATSRAGILTLSGGNQQKTLLARAVATEPKLLILDEPTRGIDVATKAEIHRDIRDLAATGVAVLVISSELPELLALSDQVHVLREGRMTASYSREQATEDAVLRAAVGAAVSTGE
ncbi:sugar ABC transporter ATP-binding protein [Microbacterium sp. NPDC058389]|uniref:sugar ABC transporter ATP-binding protein n=1 Tax=Microbacterium sp. NPDC058389 TaxID=3346475 RepID=UPI003650B6A6